MKVGEGWEKMEAKECIVCEKIFLAKKEEKKRKRKLNWMCHEKKNGRKNLKQTSTSTSSTSYRLC